MQITTGISTLQMAMNENPAVPSNRELFRTTMHKAKRTDWDLVIVKIDKQISRAGAVALAASALYFTPIFISMLLR
ncbi:MAG: hypothetical protein ACYDGO_06565 [Smithellaceae bacterium]